MAGLITFKKSLMLVDALRTFAFERYLDDRMVIDQSMDASYWSPQQSWALQVPTDRPPPVNERITNATGIRGEIGDPNYFIWLNNKLYETYQLVGALAMARPLIWATGSWLGNPIDWVTRPQHVLANFRKAWRYRAAGAGPLLGVIAKFKLGGPKANLGV